MSLLRFKKDTFLFLYFIIDHTSPSQPQPSEPVQSMIPSRRGLRAKHKRLLMLKEGRSQSLDSYEPEEDDQSAAQLSQKQTKAHSWSYMTSSGWEYIEGRVEYNVMS